jgi:hypothetical protein
VVQKVIGPGDAAEHAGNLPGVPGVAIVFHALFFGGLVAGCPGGSDGLEHFIVDCVEELGEVIGRDAARLDEFDHDFLGHLQGFFLRLIQSLPPDTSRKSIVCGVAAKNVIRCVLVIRGGLTFFQRLASDIFEQFCWAKKL